MKRQSSRSRAPRRAEAWARESLMAAVALAAMASQVNAGTIIYNNANPDLATVALGVNDAGHLNFTNSAVTTPTAVNAGFTGLAYRFSDGKFHDATSPGCLCEGWGVAVTTSTGSRIAGFANESAGSGGLTGGTFAFTGTQAESKIRLSGANVQVTHVYGVSLAANVFQGNVTITNLDSTRVENVVYRRAMDWDVPTTEFSEFVSHRGVAANLTTNTRPGNVLYASDNGFATSDPRLSAGSIYGESVNRDFTNLGPSDHGSVFDFSFGSLAPGESRTFNIFYGAAADLAGAEADLRVLRPDVVSIAHSKADDSTAAVNAPTFIFGFGGVAGRAPGLTEDNPILPIAGTPGGPVVYTFPAPTPRLWYDPPFATAFDYRLTGGTFKEVMVPKGYTNLTIVLPDGSKITGVDSGESVMLPGGVSSFRITGFSIDTATDAFRRGVAFPVFLDFTDGASGLSITPMIESGSVPLPGSLLLMLAGLAPMAFTRRRALARPAA